MIADLPALVVAGPLALAGLLLAFGRFFTWRWSDILAIVTSLAIIAGCVAMAAAAEQAPLLTWFGGWAPRHGLAIGISFLVDRTGAVVAGFAALIVAASLLFAWGFFAETHPNFHVLALLFLAGMVGFCLTHDLFNLFVWFEVMSVAAFAMTGYQLEASALEGALNFTVTNAVGSYLMLGGIGLLYARAGVLDYAALARAVAAAGPDPVVAAAFALIACALLIKAAMVPFQFWLSDAHAVARSPVSVIFSGVMVPLGLYGLARLYWSVFAGAPEVATAARHLLPAMGAVTAVVGGVMALQQRHLKRLLAFSTIAHSGIMLTGLAAFDDAGQAGMTQYLLGHGLVKGALFMVAGILLATRARIDEIDLRGLGRGIWPAGLAMAAGGLLLAGLPVGLMDRGAGLIDVGLHRAGQRWCMVGIVGGAALTGAAVLRAAARVYLGWGAEPEPEERNAPSEEEQEKANRPLWLMMVPTTLMLGLSLLGTGWTTRYALRAAAGFLHPPGDALLAGAALIAPAGPAAVPVPADRWVPWLSTGLAIAVAAWQLWRHRLPHKLRRAVRLVVEPPFRVLQDLHSGVIGDYIAWVIVGLALFSLVFATL